MHNNFDYNTYDSLHLLVKKEKQDFIENYYKKLGWLKINQTENKNYEDINDLSFIRAHNINNKDDLQLLQVHIEESLNSIGKADKNKHSKSFAIGLTFGLFNLYLLISAIIGLFFTNNNIIFYTLIALLTLIIFSSVFLTLKIISLTKKEKLLYENKINKLTKQLEIYENQAVKLLGVDYGKNEKLD